MRAIKVVTLAGSVRAGSYSAGLAALAARELALLGAEPILLSLADYPMPIYDGDLEAEDGVSPAARRLRAQLAGADGVFVVTPEYNAAVPPLLKNAIDWVSRVRDGEGRAFARDAFTGPVYAIGATSPGGLGGYRASMMLRQILMLGLNAMVIPEQMTVAGASRAFDDMGGLKEERSQGQLRTVLTTLIEQAALRAGLRA